jgi:hypothetical protein
MWPTLYLIETGTYLQLQVCVVSHTGCFLTRVHFAHLFLPLICHNAYFGFSVQAAIAYVHGGFKLDYKLHACSTDTHNVKRNIKMQVIAAVENELSSASAASLVPTDAEPFAFRLQVLTETVTIPPRAWSIVDFCFSGCRALEHVIIPPSVTNVGNYAFAKCSGLKSVKLPDGVVGIGIYAFRDCRRIVEFIIPPGITQVRGGTFYGCTRLKDITIPFGVTEIGSQAFQGCTGLETVTIPSSVTKIEPDAFHDCKSLVHITIPSGVTVIS